jgi:hypothetical protein
MVAPRTSYAIDPETGLPLLQTLGGGGLPLPLSPQDMATAGAQQVPPWAQQGPALPPELQGLPPGATASMDLGGPPTEYLQSIQQGGDRRQLLDAIGSAPPSANSHAAPAPSAPKSKVAQFASRPMPTGQPAGGGVDPSELAMPSAGKRPAGGGQGGPDVDPLVQQVFEESLRGGRGGGGPARLGVTGQTAKYFQAGEVPDEVSAEAESARAEREGHDLGAAHLADERREQIFQAKQAEQLFRAQQMEAEHAKRAEQQRQLDDYQVKRDAMLSEASSMKAPDVADYWGGMSTGAQMMTALSIALGGALQGLRGGQNPGLEMSNQAIDRWVGTQREEYQRARDGVTDADNQYARMVNTFQSENLATANLREQAYAVRDSMMQDYAEQMGTPSAKQAAQALLLQEQQRRAEGKAQAYAAAGKEIEEKLTLQGGGGGGGGGLLGALKNAAQATEYRDTIQGKNGKPQAANAELAEINKLEASLAPAEQMLKQYKDSEEIPGIGGRNVVSRGVRGAADFIAGEGSGSKMLDSNEERANRQKVNDLVAGIRNAITGSGGSNEEKAELTELVVGARTKADLQNVVRVMKQKAAVRRQLIRDGGASSSAPAQGAPSEEVVQ